MFNFFYQNSHLKEFLSAVLTIAMIFSIGGWVLFFPKPVQAIPVEDIPAAAQRAAQSAWEKIKFGWEKVRDAVASADRWLTAAVANWQKTKDILEKAAAAAAEIALHTVLRMLTNEIINWVNGGGAPRFVTDWKSFLRDAADKAGGLFIDKYLGGGWLCEPFDISIKIALLDVPTFDERVKCTISDMVANIDDFYNDFSAGGWKGWIELTKPQNNFYGAYFMALEEKLELEYEAKEAAGQEAVAGRGFLSPKVCVQGRLMDNFTGETHSTCSNANGCRDTEESADAVDYSFVCDKQMATTPASVISDVASRAIDRDLELLQDQIAALTPAKGILAPYITAISSALINRVIQEGLAFVTDSEESGPTISNPNRPMPSGTSVYQIDQAPAQVTQNQINATVLSGQQILLKENLETQLLPQQQSNLSAMQEIKSVQTNILTTLKNILSAKSALTAQEIQNTGCSLPSWASSQTTDTTIQITAPDVGSALFDKITYQIQSITPQISSQIPTMEQTIVETNQWIADSASAAISTNGYNQAIDDYLELYQQTLQPPTTQEQTALDQKKQGITAAGNLAISYGQIAAGSSANNLEQLNTDTQNTNIVVIQETNNLLQARGISQEYPANGTLYAQKQSLQQKLSQAQSQLSACSINN